MSDGFSDNGSSMQRLVYPCHESDSTIPRDSSSSSSSSTSKQQPGQPRLLVNLSIAKTNFKKIQNQQESLKVIEKKVIKTENDDGNGSSRRLPYAPVTSSPISERNYQNVKETADHHQLLLLSSPLSSSSSISTLSFDLYPPPPPSSFSSSLPLPTNSSSSLQTSQISTSNQTVALSFSPCQRESSTDNQHLSPPSTLHLRLPEKSPLKVELHNLLDLVDEYPHIRKINLKELINRETFYQFSSDAQNKLISLLPSCDCLHFSLDESQRLHPTALTNEFFNKALDDFKERFEDEKLYSPPDSSCPSSPPSPKHPRIVKPVHRKDKIKKSKVFSPSKLSSNGSKRCKKLTKVLPTAVVNHATISNIINATCAQQLSSLDNFKNVALPTAISSPKLIETPRITKTLAIMRERMRLKRLQILQRSAVNQQNQVKVEKSTSISTIATMDTIVPNHIDAANPSSLQISPTLVRKSIKVDRSPLFIQAVSNVLSHHHHHHHHHHHRHHHHHHQQSSSLSTTSTELSQSDSVMIPTHDVSCNLTSTPLLHKDFTPGFSTICSREEPTSLLVTHLCNTSNITDICEDCSSPPLDSPDSLNEMKYKNDSPI